MKFYTSEEDKKSLNESYLHLFERGIDRKLYFHIGYFTVWYAAVEIRLTLLLARATKSMTNLDSFELLTKGMDARIKILRLREALGDLIGPNLDTRLNIFDRHMRPLRNSAVHSYPVCDPTHSAIGFASLNQLPSFTKSKPPTAKPALEMPVLDFFEHGVWLNLFNNDLKTVNPGKDAMACTRFRRHRVRCFNGTGGLTWRDGDLPASSSLRL